MLDFMLKLKLVKIENLNKGQLSMEKTLQNKAKKRNEEKLTSKPIVGKDLLEFFSYSMYLDPLNLYREYIQNSVDSIDQAISSSLLPDRESGKIEISLNTETRQVSIRDNGAGLENSLFISQLTSFGNSTKRGTSARGFRGIGRLSGIGFCQELVFRSRSSNDEPILELSWDCIKLKQLIADKSFKGDLTDIVKEVAKSSESEQSEPLENFFEVVIKKPRRIGRDVLLNETKIREYLAQVAPVPFVDDFSFKTEIENLLKKGKFELPEYRIFLNDSQIYRPYSDNINYSQVKCGSIENIEKVQIRPRENEKSNSNFSAVGWIAHHDYQGAIPKSTGIRGLRARVGNMQIGEDNLFVNIFPEERFNSWCIGEIHILDQRIRPNGRRDAFELSPHYINLENQLIPPCATINKLCRSMSHIRNQIIRIENECDLIENSLAILKKHLLSKHCQEKTIKDLSQSVDSLILNLKSSNVQGDSRIKLENKLQMLEQELAEINKNKSRKKIFNENEEITRNFIDIIYENSENKQSALNLIEKVVSSFESKLF